MASQTTSLRVAPRDVDGSRRSAPVSGWQQRSVWGVLIALASLGGPAVGLVTNGTAAEPPRPFLRSIYPAGGQAGTSVTVTIEGTTLDGPPFDNLQVSPAASSAASSSTAASPPAAGTAAAGTAAAGTAAAGTAAAVTAAAATAPRLWFADSRITAVPRGPKTFEVTIPADIPCHRLDVRVVGRSGISGPRVFQVTPAPERFEQEPNDMSPPATPASATLEAPQTAVILNGRLEKPADIDCFRVSCRAGQTVVLELWADRLDSPLRGALEIFDAAGRRLAADRGRLGSVDPRIDFAVPADGEYTVRVFDQTFLGGADFVYRLTITAGPHVDFATPAMLSSSAARVPVALWGRNLGAVPVASAAPASTDGNANLNANASSNANASVNANVSVNLSANASASANMSVKQRTANPRLTSLEHQMGELDVAKAVTEWPPLRPSREAMIDVVAARWSTAVQPFPLAFANSLTLDTPPHNAASRDTLVSDASSRDTPPGDMSLLIEDGSGNHTAATARTVAVPADLSGRLEAADEQDWFAFEARRGEVFWLEGYAERLGAPVDLELFVFDAEARELLHLADQPRNPLGTRFPIDTTDPAGRFTAPRDGSYYLVASNAIGGGSADDRRRYAISFRREEADFRLVVVPRVAEVGAGLRAPRGGRESLDVLVQRRNGFTGPLRVGAANLPAGWNCAGSWIAADEDRGLLIVTAPSSGAPEIAFPQWHGSANVAGQEIRRVAVTGAATRTGDPRGVARTTHGAPIASVGEAPLFVEAALETALDSHRANAVSVSDRDPHDTAAPLPVLFQDSVVEVRVDARRAVGADGPIELQAIGLPRGVRAAFSTIAAGETRGWLSLSIARDQLAGPFSFAIQASLLPAEPSAAAATASAAAVAAAARRSAKPPVSTTVSNLISAQVAPGRIQMAIDPRTPRKIARGEVIHVRYSAERRHGFIGKIHTELAAPGGVRGIRGRGVTFTSQTETGEIQIIATENAPLGPIDGLRLEAIGTVEDQPTYLGGCLFDLEIIE